MRSYCQYPSKDGDTRAFVGIDVAKMRNAIAVAEGGREGEVRYIGEVDACDESMRRVVKQIIAKNDDVVFCYEAGPTGYGLHRLITSLGFNCMVVAPSIPRRPGDHVKNNRRGAIGLARLLRAGELTAARASAYRLRGRHPPLRRLEFGAHGNPCSAQRVA